MVDALQTRAPNKDTYIFDKQKFDSFYNDLKAAVKCVPSGTVSTLCSFLKSGFQYPNFEGLNPSKLDMPYCVCKERIGKEILTI